MNNKVFGSDVTFFGLSILAGSGAVDALTKSNFYVAGGLLVACAVFAYLYHKFGSPTNP